MIRGQKVCIRPMEREDLPFVQQLNADPVVRGRVVGWGWPSSLAEQTSWFDSQGRGGLTHRWMVERPDRKPIGVTGLWDVDWHNRNALTALKLGATPGAKGAGFGTDAIKAVMAFAFYDVGLAASIRINSVGQHCLAARIL